LAEKHPMRKTLRIVLWVVACLTFFMAGFLFIAWFTRYQPASIEAIEPLKIPLHRKTPDPLPDTLKLVTWNIGYAGLGASMDFFYDGGKRVRCSREETLENLRGIIQHEALSRRPDFILMQEVDKYARRTYYHDETELISAAFTEHTSWFVKNYDVKFVPLPWYNPMGRVVAGLLTLSKYPALESFRISLPGEFDFVTQLFMLNRCAHVLKFPASNNKKLVVINTHNTAFDDGTQRIAQWNFIRDYALKEYNEGNYVVVGGDFNLNPPCFNPNLISTGDNAYSQPGGYPPCNAFPQGWNFIYQKEFPTNRNVDEAYQRGKTPVTTIDFFILSPNISCIHHHTWFDGFRFSDHHPVEAEIVLLK